jgi:hypothetical protein
MQQDLGLTAFTEGLVTSSLLLGGAIARSSVAGCPTGAAADATS